MTDIMSKEQRSFLMSQVKSKDTKPERIVRSLIHGLGYRFRLHSKSLPGKPDIVLPQHKKVVLVHGCFWHRHARCRKSRLPTTNVIFWHNKISGNIDRDRLIRRKLKALGYKVLVVWECQTSNLDKLEERLRKFLEL